MMKNYGLITLVVLPLLLSSCNLPRPTQPVTTQPGQVATVPPLATAGPTPTLPGPAIAHIPAGQAVDIMKIHMLDPFSGWGLGGLNHAQDHVFRTQDGGDTWRDVTPPQPVPASGDTPIATGHFRDASTAWVIYGSELVPPPAFLYFWMTHDGGTTWEYSAIDTSSSEEFFNPWMMDFVDATHGWLLIYLGAGMSHNYVNLLRTTDGGLTWQTLVTPQDNNDIQGCSKSAMVFSDIQNGWLARECQGLYPAPHIMHTTDGGATWTRIDPPPPAGDPNLFTDYACDMLSPNPFSSNSVVMAMKCLNQTDYTTQKDYVYLTTDGGTTWTSHPLPANFSLGEGLYFFDPMNGFAFGRKIYRTSDGGQTWTKVVEVTWSGQFSFVNASLGWASVINDQGQIALVSTDNGGALWDMLNPLVVH